MKYDIREEVVSDAPWAFIGVMGVTGAGKSTFIKWASGNQDIEIGHNLESCTSEVTAYTFHFNGYNVSLVDTPGFNDTHRSETEVLQDIANWLQGNYEKSTRLNGIIYLHSLVNVRMEGSALRNLKMFRQLCGNEPLKNVILATTFWSKVAEQDALRREEQLRATPEFWGDMLQRGSTMQRLVDRNSALEIIRIIVQKPQVTLRIQHELVDNNMPLVETAAGQTVNEELMRLKEKHKEDLDRVQKELQEALEERDHEMQQILEKQQQRLDKQIDKVHQQQELLLYDRRAERRKTESQYEYRLQQMEDTFERRHSEMRDSMARRQQELMQEWSFDQAVAVVRANEGQLSVQDREKLEKKIEELSKKLALSTGEDKPGEVSSRKKKGSSRYLFKALQVIFPATTFALLGFPLPSPFGSGNTAGEVVGKLFGGGTAEQAEA